MAASWQNRSFALDVLRMTNKHRKKTGSSKFRKESRRSCTAKDKVAVEQGQDPALQVAERFTRHDS